LERKVSECYSGVENLEVMQEAHNYNRYLLNLVISEGRGVPSALDFGAGIGTFASALRKYGTRVICIEPDLPLRQRLLGEQFEAYSSLDPIPEKSVPYIYSLNVLEHIDDDLGALRELYRRLMPAGTLLIYVPAFEILYSSADKRIGHKRRYTKDVLVRRLEMAGFEVDEARYADSLGFWVALLFKFMGNKEGRVSPLAVKIFDKWIFPLSTTLDHVMGRVAGKNVLVIAHRPHHAVSEEVEAQCSPVA
jgi:SAM-dependent methyltransferase